MVSEAVSAGKRTIVFKGNKIRDKKTKHEVFLDRLLDAGYLEIAEPAKLKEIICASPIIAKQSNVCHPRPVSFPRKRESMHGVNSSGDLILDSHFRGNDKVGIYVPYLLGLVALFISGVTAFIKSMEYITPSGRPPQRRITIVIIPHPMPKIHLPFLV